MCFDDDERKGRLNAVAGLSHHEFTTPLTLFYPLAPQQALSCPNVTICCTLSSEARHGDVSEKLSQNQGAVFSAAAPLPFPVPSICSSRPACVLFHTPLLHSTFSLSGSSSVACSFIEPPDLSLVSFSLLLHSQVVVCCFMSCSLSYPLSPSVATLTSDHHGRSVLWCSADMCAVRSSPAVIMRLLWRVEMHSSCRVSTALVFYSDLHNDRKQQFATVVTLLTMAGHALCLAGPGRRSVILGAQRCFPRQDNARLQAGRLTESSQPACRTCGPSQSKAHIRSVGRCITYMAMS